MILPVAVTVKSSPAPKVNPPLAVISPVTHKVVSSVTAPVKCPVPVTCKA